MMYRTMSDGLNVPEYLAHELYLRGHLVLSPLGAEILLRACLAG